jgi:hypothetical protein
MLQASRHVIANLLGIKLLNIMHIPDTGTVKT